MDFRLDGHSPLVRYADFALWLPDVIERWRWRDERALQILSQPALAWAVERAYMRAHNRTLPGKLVKAPRVWTRRDGRAVCFHEGRVGGWLPMRRLGRLLRWLGDHPTSLFQAGYREARESHCSVSMDLANRIHDGIVGLLDAAHGATQGDRACDRLAAARSSIEAAVNRLLPLLPPSQQVVDQVAVGATARPQGVVSEPADWEFKAYRAHKVMGMKQALVANELTRTQGEVSKACKKVAAWLEAGNVMPVMAASRRRQPMAVDPSTLDRLARRNRSDD